MPRPMLFLARTTRGLFNTSAVHAFVRADAVKSTTPWTIRRSSHMTPIRITEESLENGDREGSPNRNEAGTTTTTTDSDSLVRRADLKVRSKSPREAQRPVQPRQTPRPPATAKSRSGLVADMTDNDFNSTAPSVVPPWRSNTQEPKSPANFMAKTATVEASSPKSFVSVRREVIKSLPTVVVFSGLKKNTTITDVLLGIREACVAGNISSHEASVVDAWMLKPLAGEKTQSATVDFTEPSGAERMYSLTDAGRFTIRGLVPQVSLIRRRGIRRFPGPDDRPAMARPVNLTTADPMEKRSYLDRLKVKDRPVRRTHLNYNRDPSAAAEDKEQLMADVAFKSIFADRHLKSTGSSGNIADWETDEASRR